MDALDKIPSCVESSHTPDYGHSKQSRAEVLNVQLYKQSNSIIPIIWNYVVHAETPNKPQSVRRLKKIWQSVEILKLIRKLGTPTNVLQGQTS